MTRERIEDFREIVLPYVSRTLLKTNYENAGKSDAEEFEKDFNGILDLAIQALEQEPCDWIPVSERLPEKGGDYLTTQKVSFSDYVYRSVSSYALNLHDVDEYDFEDKKRPGWYEYDREWGYYELDGVIAWMPLPEPHEEVE